MNQVVVGELVTMPRPDGLHGRPSFVFTELANRFESKIELVRDKECVNAKSMLEVFSLGVNQGCSVRVKARGPDAHDAVVALSACLEGNNDEDFWNDVWQRLERRKF